MCRYRVRLLLLIGGLCVGDAYSVQAMEEFVGPFASWANVKADYGAVGDGRADDAGALQKALDDLRREDRKSHVLYIPAGTYRITQTLKLSRDSHEESKDIGIFGADPPGTTIVWDGPQNGVMMLYNAWYSQMGRITFDGQSRASTAVKHGPAFTTYNEFSDMVFRDVGFGIEAGMKYGIAETTVWRCRFLRCSKAGISIQNFNSLDWFIWDCTFENCRLGVTNVFGAGNFHVYRSLFRRSVEADISMGNTAYFSLRNNTSIESKAFFVAGAIGACGNITIQGNKVTDPQDVPIQVGNLGPLLLLDNVVKCRKSPAVRVNTNAGFLSAGNTFTVKDPIKAKPNALKLDDKFLPYDSVEVTESTPFAFAALQDRPVIEVPVGSGSADIQKAIDVGCKMNGRRPVIHLPAGTYRIDRPLVIPAGCDVQLIGDGCDSVLRCAGKDTAGVLRLAGPSRATLRDFSIDGATVADGIVIDNCDQPRARIFMDQANVSGARQVGLFVDGLEKADVGLYNINHGGNKVGIKVVGGPAMKAGDNVPGRVVIFSGSSSNNEISYAVEDGGGLLVRDMWYESGQFPRFMHCKGFGSFTLHGAMVAPTRKEGIPAVEIDGFKGKLTFLTSIFHCASKSAPIVYRGRDAKVLLLGIQTGMGDDYLVSHSQHGRVALLESFQYTKGGGPKAVPDHGRADAKLIREMLAQTRSANPQPLEPVAPGVTDFRLYRVCVYNTQVGIHIVP